MSGLRSSPGFWALSMGAVGGAAGFLGPIFLNPEANQGPMLGLLITGPGGALAGALLGFIFRLLPFTDTIRTQALTLLCAMLGVGTLWYALPEPREAARVLDATIARCRAASTLLAQRVAHWDERIVAVRYTQPRTGWREDLERMQRATPGVVVTLEVARANVILRHARPWDRGRLSATGWTRVGDSHDYFGGGSCEHYPLGRKVMLMPTGAGSQAWPPDDLPNFLGLQVLAAVPPDYRALVTRP